MDLNGVWKGEYITQWFSQRTGREVSVPFVMKIQMTAGGRPLPTGHTLFEGICQDDPEVSKITLHADIAGSAIANQVYFIKQYPGLLIRNSSDEVEIHEGMHPEIVYQGEFNTGAFEGTWNMSRTFRKIKGNLCELMPMRGSWWMKKV